MKIALITDVHLGDHRHDKEFDIRKLELMKEEFASTAPDIIVNTADTVSRDEYLRPEYSKTDYWNQYLEFRSSLNCQVVEVCLERETSYFAKMFDLSGNYYRTDFAECTFFCITPEYDYDHRLSQEQISWLETEFKNTDSRWQFLLSHVPIEQATDRLPGEGIYLTDSARLKKIAHKHGNFTFFIGGHFHKMPPPKIAPDSIMIMGGIVDSLNAKCNDLHVRYLELNEQTVNLETRTIDMLSGKSSSRKHALEVESIGNYSI